MINNYTNQRYRGGTFRSWLTACMLMLISYAGFAQGYVILGTQSSASGTTTSSPYNDFYESRHLQVVYSAAEILAAGGASGNISRLAWDVNALISRGAYSLAGYTIKMKNVAYAIPPSPLESAALTTVYGPTALTSATITATGFNDITFATPFNWDGTSNVLVDVCWGVNSGYSFSGRVWTYTGSTNNYRANQSSTASRCAIYNGLTGSTAKPRIRFYMQQASCFPPSSLTASAITGSSATLSWTAGVGATSYDVYYGASPLAAPTGGTTPTTTTATNSVGIGSLSALTTYVYYVRTDCGGIKTAWIGPYTFQTGCSGTSCTYNAIIEDDYGDGWNGCNVEVRQDGVLTQTITLASGAGPQTVPINICTGATVVFKFNSVSYPGETIFTLNDPFASPIYSWAAGANPAGGTNFSTFVPTCLPPACALPGSPVVSQLTVSTANVTWTAAAGPPANGYDIYYGPTISVVAPTGASTPDVDNNPTNSYTWTGLTAGTSYQIWVRADCGGAQSSWVGPVTYIAPPANNLCSGAVTITCGNTYSGSLIGTTGTGNPGAGCGSGPATTNGAWYHFVGDGSDVTVSTCALGTTEDTEVNVYSAPACGGPYTCIGGNDDDAACTFASTLASTYTFTSVLGTNYYIYVTTYSFGSVTTGVFNLTINCIPPTSPPANDDCATAQLLVQLPVCVSTAGSTLGATVSIPAVSCNGFTGAGEDVWYTFQATTTAASVQVDGDPTFDGVVIVYDACGGTVIGCADNTFSGGLESVNLTGLTIGTFYTVRVYAYAATGNGGFDICVVNFVDPCSSITPVTCGTPINYNETGAGVYDVAACGWTTPGKERFYTFTPTVTGTYQIQVLSTTGGYVDYFYKAAAGGCNDLGWTCVDDIFSTGYYPMGALTAGTPYLILLDGEGTGAYNHNFQIICIPANDLCANAQTLVEGASCVLTTGTLLGSNATPAISANDLDVWYKFTAVGTSANIKVVATSLLAAGIEVFTSCAATTPICIEYAQAQGETITLNATGLTNGTLYYFRVIDQLAGDPFYGPYYSSYQFSVCVTIPPAIGAQCITAPPGSLPEAEVCGGTDNNGCALGIPVFEAYTLGDFVSGTVVAECGTRDLDYYEFTVGGVSPVALNVSAEFPAACFITTAACPGVVKAFAQTSNECDIITASTVLTPGTYRIIIAPNTFSGIPCTSTRNEYFFQMVIAPPPANDDCANAQAIVCGLPGTCPANQVIGTTLAAVEETFPAIPDPACNTGNISDVWYKFTTGTTTTEIEVNLEYLSATMVGVELFSACGAGNAIVGTCVSDGGAVSPMTFTVTPSTTYRLRVFTNYDTQNPGTYKLCVQKKPSPPVNDDICGAIDLPIYQTLPVMTSGTNFYATQSPQAAMSCGSHARDVWYKVTVPATGSVTINASAGTFTDMIMSAYTAVGNVCSGALTSVGCDDDRGPGDISWLQVNNLTPGSILFIRVAGFGTFPSSLMKGTFNIGITEGLVWTGAASTDWGTIADSESGFPSNWYAYDGGSFGPNILNNANISVLCRTNVANQPQVSGTVDVKNVRFAGTLFNTGGVEVLAAGQLQIRGSVSVSGGVIPRFTGAGTTRFHSTVATTHNIFSNARYYGNVTVAPTSTVTANGKMLFENGASLFADSPASTYGSVTGNIVYRRQGNPASYAYNYWASPVAGATIASISSAGASANTYYYNPAAATGPAYAQNQLGWIPASIATNMLPTVGYIATAANLATFTGVPNQNATYAHTAVAGGVNFNLMGNPFPAPMSAATFLAQNSARIQGGVIYIYDSPSTPTYANSDYIVSNGVITVNGPNSGLPFSGNIAACQAFFVNYVPAGAINFNRTARIVGNNSQFFDAEVYPFIKLKVQTADNHSAETAIGFTADASEGLDMRDADYLPGSSDLQIYTAIDTRHLVMQFLPELNAGRVLPLGVIANASGTSTISLSAFENFDASTVVLLEDTYTGTFYNLRTGNYEFQNVAGVSTETRFFIHFRAPIQINATASCDNQANGKIIFVNQNNTPVGVEVKNSANTVVASVAPFTGEAIVNQIGSNDYTLNYTYQDGIATTSSVSLPSTGVIGTAAFVASSNNVTIADAIVEFQGSAAGCNEFVWDFGDGSVVTGDQNPVHAYMQPGVYTVTFTALKGGCSTTATSTVTVSSASTTGIANVSDNSGFTIFPNPANESAKLLLNVDLKDSEVSISITDAAGRLVSKNNVNSLRAGSIIELDIDNLANGVYEVALSGKNFRNVGRLTIAK